jgi:hypothetical protein
VTRGRDSNAEVVMDVHPLMSISLIESFPIPINEATVASVRRLLWSSMLSSMFGRSHFDSRKMERRDLEARERRTFSLRVRNPK